MSGIVGHTLYAVLGAKAGAKRGLPLAAIALRHFPGYLAGAYLGCDIQCMPEAVCLDTGFEVGFGTVPLTQSPLTGGKVRPWTLRHDGREYRPQEIYDLFYGRSHLVFGWTKSERDHAVPWDRLPEYFAAALEDAIDLFGPGERQLAYLAGWMVHVVSDTLIKSHHPGVELHLLDGKYTPRNRPIQDLVSFHEIGRKEFHLDWPAVFADLAATPVEPAQLHYMRVAAPRGRLSRMLPEHWLPARESLLLAVLAENRRWCRSHAEDVLRELALVPGPAGVPDCSEKLRATTGLTYRQMLELAAKAGFRHALRQIGEAVADMMESTLKRSPRLAGLAGELGPTWDAWPQRL